jgi:broad specificity phosphatase PhoE
MSTIYLIRHAEKPDGANDGVTAAGAYNKKSLIVRGWQRAGALAVFFGPQGGVPSPDRIYASASGKIKLAPGVKVGSDSERPVLTVTPLAARLGMTPLATFTKGQESALAREVVALQQTTLVCWQHEAIPAIAKLILGAAASVPDSWPADRFDVVWRCVRSDGGSWTFDQLCPQLLFGDRATPIC